jgi:hypothetical protein
MRVDVRLAPLLLVLLLGFSYTATVDLPQSGQTKCYNEAGTEIACAGTGQDGDTEGRDRPSFSQVHRSR